MNWSFGASLPSLLFGSLIWAFSVWICYTNWQRSGRRRAVARLESLRFILITLLLLTLLRPEVVRTLERREKPAVAILVDASRSMSTRDIQNGTNFVRRRDWLHEQTQRAFWKPLEKTARVVRDEFSNPSALTNSTVFKVEGTDLNAALENVLEHQQNLKAVLLLTDGDWNMGKSPLGAATLFREKAVPLFSVTVGRETPLPDLVLEQVTPPSYGLFGEQITIPFRLRSHLSNEVKTTISLLHESRQETKKEVTIPPFGEIQDTVLWYPRAVGTADLSLKIPVHAGEALPENNEQKFRLNVRVDTLKVLVVDSLPRWEYRYLRNALARDPGVEMHCILYHPGMRTGGGKHYLPVFPGTREALSRYDVIFLGDVGIGEGELSAQDAELIKGLVEQQASGLVFLPGKRARHLTLVQSALKDLWPVQLDEAKPDGFQLQNEAVLTLTTLGKGHLLTRFEADENLNAQVWQNLPGFFWSAGVEKSRPGSEVLAVHSSLRNASGRLPLLTIRSAGAGKVLFLGTDSAWRWRRGVEDKYHYRFWSQVVRWMAHQRHLSEKEGIRLTYSPERPQPNDTVYLQTTVLNSSGFPLDEGPVHGTIISPGGRAEQVQFSGLEGGWGVFKSSFSAQESGKFKIVVEAPKHGRKLETELTVEHPILEKEGQPANPSILEEIATITGGKNARVDQLDKLVQDIALSPAPKPLEQRIRIWSSPYWGAFLLFLLTIYWVGRKLAGML